MSETFADWLQRRYGLRPEQVRPTGTAGYWEAVEPCGGLSGGCRAPVHGVLGIDGPMHHTIYFRDSVRDERGRLASPYRTWRQAREEGVR